MTLFPDTPIPVDYFKCAICGNHTWIIKGAPHDKQVLGIYCGKCGRWLKWLGKFK